MFRACSVNGIERNKGPWSLETSPEVYHVRNAMDATGPVDLMLDVHGDEAEPYCFIIGGEGTPGWDERRAGLQRDFKTAYARACPDFQTTFPLEYGSAPSGNVITAKTQVRATRGEGERVTDRERARVRPSSWEGRGRGRGRGRD